MIKGGGTAAEAKKLADEFQALMLDVMFEKKDIKDENDIIAAKSLPGTKKKEPAKLPSDFVTNDDFCPGCGLELKSMPIERTELLDRRVPARSAGRLRSGAGVRADQAGPARVSRLGTRAAAERRAPPLHRRPARGHRGAAQGSAAEVPLRARRRRRREAGRT